MPENPINSVAPEALPTLVTEAPANPTEGVADTPVSLESFDDPRGLALETPEAPEALPADGGPEAPEAPETPAAPDAPAAPETPVASGSIAEFIKAHPEADLAAVKQMSRAAREAYGKALDVVKELQSKQAAQDPNSPKLPENWYEEPDAWRLDPEIKALAPQLGGIDAEQQFLRSQLDAANNAEKFTVPGYVDGVLTPCVFVNGTLVPARPGEGMEPTERAKESLREAIANANLQKGKLAGRLEELKSSFTQRHAAENARVEKLLQDNAPWSSDAKHPMTLAASKILADNFPKALQKNPLAKTAAHSFAYAVVTSQENQALKKEIAGLKQLQQQGRQAPPVPSQRRPAGPAKQEKAFTLADF